MVMIVVDAAKKEELEVVLHQAGVVGYTELAPAAGRGTTGLKLGSRAFPRTSAVILTALGTADLERLKQGISAFCEHCGERLKMLAWEVEEVL